MRSGQISWHPDRVPDSRVPSIFFCPPLHSAVLTIPGAPERPLACAMGFEMETFGSRGTLAARLITHAHSTR